MTRFACSPTPAPPRRGGARCYSFAAPPLGGISLRTGYNFARNYEVLGKIERRRTFLKGIRWRSYYLKISHPLSPPTWEGTRCYSFAAPPLGGISLRKGYNFARNYEALGKIERRRTF